VVWEENLSTFRGRVAKWKTDDASEGTGAGEGVRGEGKAEEHSKLLCIFISWLFENK